MSKWSSVPIFFLLSFTFMSPSFILDVDQSVKDRGANIKNVEVIRQELCKEFMSTSFWGTKCPHCLMPARPIRTENMAKVFFFKGISKNALNRYYTQKLREYEVKQR